jgi:hypothetical protein
MLGFEEFDIRCWAERGLTFALPRRQSASSPRRTSRPGLKYIVSAAAAVSLMAFMSTANYASENTRVITEWHERISTNGGTPTEGAEFVPQGYWAKLVSAVKVARQVADDDYSHDPDPLF